MNRLKKIFLILIVLILVSGLAVGVYVSDYYPAGEAAAMALADKADITVEIREDYVLFSPALPEAAFLFYPGGKVEYTAYAPLMRSLAEENILCILVKMPGNLAVLDPDAADKILPQFPEIHRWYIGGHSLGGSMAASWAAGADRAEGLVLLASYSTADLSASDLRVLSLYGDRDQIMNLESYEKYRKNLPEDTVEMVISGGNHSQFGDYGHQECDGEAGITASQQLQITADAILELIRQ